MKSATWFGQLSLKVLRSVITVGFLLFVVPAAFASDPIGIYALVDKVVLEPNEQAPDRIKLWGTFLIAKDRSDFEAPARGFLYFTLPKEKHNVARIEWADLKKLAGTAQVVAFGSRFQYWNDGRPKVRKAEEKTAAPDTYTLGVGLIKVNDSNPVVQRLRAAAPVAPPTPAAARTRPQPPGLLTAARAAAPGKALR